MDLKNKLRRFEDFPTPGIVFWDISPLLADSKALAYLTQEMAGPFRGRGVTQVAAAESRGFIFGTLVARELGAGLVMFRKPGKLPFRVVKQGFQLEYGSTSVEAHVDSIHPHDRVLIVDDVIATGGTANAAVQLVAMLEGTVVGCSFLIELDYLHGREKLGGIETHSLIHIADSKWRGDPKEKNQ